MEGMHPLILDALVKTNMQKTAGYGTDEYCASAREKILAACGLTSGEVHFLVGGTQTNATVIKALLRPYEGVIAASTGHIALHEAGAIEASGHKVLTIPAVDGKLSAVAVDEYIKAFRADEAWDHMVWPGMVYISQPTEYGTLYTLAELEALSAVCRKWEIPLFVDGARLGYALASPATDVTLKDLARLCDVFYIGGTKIGALFGEALVLVHPEKFDDRFRYMIKRQGALLAKGRLISVQLKALFEGGNESLYFELSRYENELAVKLAKGIEEAGYEFWVPHQTNQLFVIMDNEKIAELEKDFFFYTWCPYDESRSVIRLVISWGTTEEDVEALLKVL